MSEIAPKWCRINQTPQNGCWLPFIQLQKHFLVHPNSWRNFIFFQLHQGSQSVRRILSLQVTSLLTHQDRWHVCCIHRPIRDESRNFWHIRVVEEWFSELYHYKDSFDKRIFLLLGSQVEVFSQMFTAKRTVETTCVSWNLHDSRKNKTRNASFSKKFRAMLLLRRVGE